MKTRMKKIRVFELMLCYFRDKVFFFSETEHHVFFSYYRVALFLLLRDSVNRRPRREDAIADPEKRDALISCQVRGREEKQEGGGNSAEGAREDCDALRVHGALRLCQSSKGLKPRVGGTEHDISGAGVDFDRFFDLSFKRCAHYFFICKRPHEIQKHKRASALFFLLSLLRQE